MRIPTTIGVCTGGTVASALELMQAVADARESGDPSQAFTLRLLGDPILKQPATRVAALADVAPGLIAALTRECEKFRGLGMSAQQVGSTQRVCIAMLRKPGRPKNERERVTMLNPRITQRSAEMVLHTAEGCLSVPGFRTSVRRHASITVAFEDTIDFATHTVRLNGTDAQILQHEIDHLDGRCIADGVSRPQRRQAERLVAAYRGRV